MTTVGEILKNKRKELKLNLTQIEKETKIRTRFLEKIENDEFSSIDPITLRGFVKNYASFLGLEENEILAFYRRQANQSNLVTLPQRSILLGKWKFTPRLFGFLGVFFLLTIFAGFLSYQYLLFISAPPLSVETPLESTVSKKEFIQVKGKTSPDVVVTINNQHVQINNLGYFDEEIPLKPGINEIIIQSTNKYQKSTSVTRHVRLEIP